MKNVQSHKYRLNFRAHKLQCQAGFTLMEILLVMALLGGLVVLVLPRIGDVLNTGQEDTVKIYVSDTMKASLFRYRIDNGRFPSTEEGLQALLTELTGAKNWRGPYVDELPSDPWGNGYQYSYPGQNNTDSYDLYSFGVDGVESGDDIGNW